MSSQSLTQKAGRSAVSQLIGGGSVTVIRLVASVFLARALTPTDFGLIGMAVLLREFVFVLGSIDMVSGIVVKDDLKEEDLCTFFWSMAALRVLMFLSAFFGAPLAIYLFDDPRVVDVLRAISFTFLLNIMAVAAYAILSKKMKFFYTNITSVLSVLIESLLAVVLVLFTDLGYWALVVSMLVQAFISNAALMLLARWFPKFKFSRESFRYLFRFGINNLGAYITRYLRQNLDYILVGRLLGTKSLGLYEFAYRIPDLVLTRISRPVGAVVMPALSHIKNDNHQLVLGYTNVVTNICLIIFPLLFGLAAVADIAVPLLWGNQWLTVITPLRLLCLCAALRLIPENIGAVFNCKNRPDLPFKISLVGLIWTAVVVSVLGSMYGLNGVAVAMVLSVIPSYVSLIIASRLLQLRLPIFKALTPSFVSATACGLGAYAVSCFLNAVELPLGWILPLAIIFGAIVYIFMLYFFFPKTVSDALVLLKKIAGIELRWTDKLVRVP